MNKCIYCPSIYTKDSEHVFPLGLGGEDLFCDFVCPACNNKFSSLEAELYQKSIIALERSIEGIEGYEKSKDKPAQFKAALLLAYDNLENIIYEVGQFSKMNIYLRPQIIKIKNRFYLEGDNQESLNYFAKELIKWKQKNLILVESSNIKNSKVEDYIKIEKNSEGVYQYTKISTCIKVDNQIRIDMLPDSHEAYHILTPRLFLDDRDSKKNRLRIRSKNQSEALQFITDLLNYIDLKNEFISYPIKNLDTPIIYVGLSFNTLNLQRAVMKIGLNCLIYYYPEVKEKDVLNDLIEYVNTGKGDINIHFEAMRNDLIDTDPETHNILFYQSNDRFSIRISLFNGKFIHNIYISELTVFPELTYNKLIIDYKKRLNVFQNQREFFESFERKAKPPTGASLE